MARAYADTIPGTLINLNEPTRSHAASVTLSYTRDDPYAVTATITLATKCDTADWLLSRDLLRGGLHNLSGIGDAIAWPEDGGVLHLVLTGEGGRAALQLDAVEVARFLDRTDRIVHPGDESRHVDIDGAIRAMLKREHR